MSGPILLTRASRWRNGLPVFLTTAERDLNIPSPMQGEACYVDDNTSAEGLQTFSGTAWRPVAWNTSWGNIAQVIYTGVAQSGITTITDITGATVSYTAIANRKYRWTWNATFNQVTAASTGNITLTDGSNAALSNPGVTIAAGGFAAVAGQYEGTQSGAKTHKLRASTGAGTLTILNTTANPTVLSIDDIGPSGAPS